MPRQKPTRREGWLRALIALLMAVGGHAIFLSVLLFLSLLKLNVPEQHKKKETKPVVLRGLSAEQWAQNRGEARLDGPDRPSRRERPEEKKKELKPEERPQGQIVDVAPGNNQQDPNAKYIAETNNKAAKETRAKDQTAFYKNAAPRRTSPNPIEGNGSDSVDKAQVAGNNGLGQDDRPLREGAQKPIFEMPDSKRSPEVAMRDNNTQGPGAEVNNRHEQEDIQGNSDRLRVLPGAPGGGEDASQGRTGTPGVANLLPSPAVLDKIMGAAANDHLKDVEEGDGTYLSTKEWKYASFFNRVKQSVGQHWDPGTQLRLRDPTGNVYGGRDRYTVLNVTLNERGQVKEIFVEKSSGIDFLDLEAIHSFERAQPFPNPPPGLVTNDSNVRFSFGFFLEMSGSPRMRLFRSAN